MTKCCKQLAIALGQTNIERDTPIYDGYKLFDHVTLYLKNLVTHYGWSLCELLRRTES